MVKRNLLFAAASAAILVCATAVPAGALDLGGRDGGGLGKSVSKTVRSVTRSVSKTVGGVTGGLSGGSKSSSSYGGKTAGKSSSGKSVNTGVASVGTKKKSKSAIDVNIKTWLFGKTRVDAELLGKKGVANVKAKTGLLNTKAKVGVLSGGKLLGLDAHIGGSKGGNGGGGNGGGGNGGGGNGGGGNVPGPIADMSDGQIQALKVQCYDILNSPRRFERDLVKLCQLLAKL